MADNQPANRAYAAAHFALELDQCRRIDRLDREFSPRGSREELEEELEDIRHRGAAAIDLEKGFQA